MAHPADAVLQAYRARGILVYRTDRDGEVWLTGRRSQPALKIHRMNDERIRPLSFLPGHGPVNNQTGNGCSTVGWRHRDRILYI